MTGGSSQFRVKTLLFLTANEVKRKFDQYAKLRDRVLSDLLSDYLVYPADAKLAMLVHSWALWPSKDKQGNILFKGKQWPKYTAACKSHHWWSRNQSESTAAKESRWSKMSYYFYQQMILMFKNAQAVNNARKKSLQTDVKKLYYPQQAL